MHGPRGGKTDVPNSLGTIMHRSRPRGDVNPLFYTLCYCVGRLASSSPVPWKFARPGSKHRQHARCWLSRSQKRNKRSVLNARQAIIGPAVCALAKLESSKPRRQMRAPLASPLRFFAWSPVASPRLRPGFLHFRPPLPPSSHPSPSFSYLAILLDRQHFVRSLSRPRSHIDSDKCACCKTTFGFSLGCIPGTAAFERQGPVRGPLATFLTGPISPRFAAIELWSPHDCVSSPHTTGSRRSGSRLNKAVDAGTVAHAPRSRVQHSKNTRGVTRRNPTK